MKRALALLLVVAVVAATAITVGAATAAPAKKQDTSLSGAGSSFVFPLVSKWIPALGSAYGYNVSYSPIGSGGGIAAITAKTVDFGASDAPLSNDQATACTGCVQIPWALSATSIMYNLPGANCVLRLTGPILAKIYLGEITTWNDAGDHEDQPEVHPVRARRSRPCTARTTPARRTTSPTTSRPSARRGSRSSASASTRSGRRASGASGSSGVAGVITKTEGAIGYADVAYALKNKIRFASMLNASGKYATPGLRGSRRPRRRSRRSSRATGRSRSSNPPKGNPLAYPISTFTYVIASSGSSKSAELKKMIYWAVTRGQTFGQPLLFQPLPLQVQAFAFKQIKKL